MQFTIPLPIPLNQTYKHGKSHVYKNRKVKDWEEEAGWEIKRQIRKQKKVSGNLYVCLAMYLKWDRDIDSSIKTVLDLLQGLKIYDNDSQITFLNVRKEFDKKNPRMEIEVNCL